MKWGQGKPKVSQIFHIVRMKFCLHLRKWLTQFFPSTERGARRSKRPSSHCSYLNIYISQKIILCNGDFEGKFQNSAQASITNFLIWKFRFIILIFLLFFAGVVKSTAFCTLLLLFQWLDTFKLQFDTKMCLNHFKLLEIAVTVCKKQWIWQLLPKIEGKWV